MGKKSERKPGTKTVKTTIVIDEKLWERLRGQATRERRPAQDIVEDALAAYIKGKA